MASVTPILAAVPVVTIVLAIRRTPPAVALLLGAFLGIAAALVFQRHFGTQVILNALATGLHLDTGVADVDALVNRGGIANVMDTVSLAIIALGFGELLQKLGVLAAILEKVDRFVVTPARLVLTTLASCAVTNMLQRLVAFFVEQHNTVPHSSFKGQTPDELYRGTGDGVVVELAQARTKARRERIAKNRAARCSVCPNAV